MKHLRKLLSTFLIVCLMLSVLPAEVFAATTFPDNTVEPANYTVGVSSKAELQERLNTLVAKYKDTYWTSSGNPCSAHGTTCYSRYYYAWQCKGFAGYIFNDLFCGGNIGPYDTNMYYIPSAKNANLVDKVWGISSSDTTSVKNILSKAQPGDYIQARRRNKSYGHTMIVLSVTDTGINIFDCNSDGKCGVKTYFQTWATFASKNSGFSLYHSTKYPSNSDETGCGCSTSYAGEYTCTTKAGNNLYIRTGHGGSYSTIGKIPSGATVTVTKASGTGDGDWAHVEYNGVSGYASMQYLKMPIDQQAPTISNVSITDVNLDGYTITCTVTDDSGISAVKFPTWTEPYQDDLMPNWGNDDRCNGTCQGNSYSFRVLFADHNNEYENYRTHIYAWDTAGNTSSYIVNEQDFNFPIGQVDTMTGGVQSIRISGWAYDKDDLSRAVDIQAYIGGNLIAYGTANKYYPSLNTSSDHANVGDYHGFDLHFNLTEDFVGSQKVTVIAIDKEGMGNPIISSTNVYIEEDNEKPVISDVIIYDVTTTGYSISCTVTDNIGVKNVKFPTWTEPYQDDLMPNWENDDRSNGTRQGNSFSFRVLFADHNNERKDYRTHIYAWDMAGNAESYILDMFSAQYTIHYDANGGTGAPKDETKEHGSNGFTLSTVIPTRSGYTFDGWTLKQWETHPGIVGNVYEPGQTYLGNSDTTFYALWYKCNHSFGSWEQVKAPTCTKEGEEQRTCKNCGHSESRKVPPKGHTEVTDKAVAATCLVPGKTEGKHCSVCNDVIVAQKSVAAKGHTEVIDKAVAATCTSAGKTEGKHCSVCNAVIVAQKSVAAKGHTEVIDKAVAATCTSAGKTEGKHCSVCNTVIVAQQSTPKKNHTEVIDAAIAATCTSTGKTEGKHCSVCNTVIIAQQTVPKCGHTEIVIPGSNNFTFGIKCSACGKTILEQKAIAVTADANPNSVYAPIIQAAISECVYMDEGYGALYDVDGNGTDELIMMYDAEVPVPQGSIFPCTVYSIYTLSDGQPVALIEKEILFTLAGGPFGHLAVVERDGSKYIFTTYESGETGGENIKRWGRCNLYKLDGATLVLDTSVEYTAQYGYNGINYSKSSATINGNTVSYQEYESWVDSLNELVIINNMYEEDSKNAAPLEELYNMVMKSAGCSHSATTIPGKSATCTQIGYTSGSYCTKCSAVLTPQQIVAPTGHVYSDAGDLTCNTCGQTRLLNANRPTVNMYRMYDPNSGEHFYTGSDEERNNLVSVGWNYEGVGFTFPLTTGLPVYRLYDPVHGEHLYTMDENEKATLINQGWKYEGIAFNSGFENEVPQYRLHNPNATRGAYHFTASIEERNTLISLGWEYQGIGWYSCWN